MTDIAQRIRNVAFLLNEGDGHFIPKYVREAVDELERLSTILSERKVCELAYQDKQIAELRRDAERYRYLRERNGWVGAFTGNGFYVRGEELDNLVDEDIESDEDWPLLRDISKEDLKRVGMNQEGE